MKDTKSYRINQSRKNVRLSRGHLVWLIIGAALLFSLIFGWAKLHTTKPAPEAARIPSAQHSDDNTTSKADISKTVLPKPSDKTNGPVAAPALTGSGPIAPFGSFVSSHNISKSKATLVDSNCNTTPGATCSISFTNDAGAVHYLDEQKTDSNGSAYWSWSADTAGLTPGTWHVSATARRNGQSKTATDPQTLKVTS